MKVFQFHLQKVLDVKEKEKEQAEWAFGKSVQRKNEEEWKLGKLEGLREQATGMLHSAQSQSQTVSISRLMEIARYRESVDRSISRQKATLYGCEQEVERCQRRLTEQMKETQLWQKLRDKAQGQYLEALKQREQKEMDEIGTQLYLRKSN
ncbi:flagellar export protein FliJ [Brevibacillus composti]|uniref:Flagellar FliJ protein n=1 Tax=Brevibacillus composti TaxID=2796470 RepID=A0A7T5EP21_9BACL|nr:flagellar export protein FliJ [Brevibacillus composti]QQE76131.1 flagellar export protein FliJ [Brevibacillus composti]QUO43160.1 flagellar export protein FliJ [Brevibacillus composti]